MSSNGPKLPVKQLAILGKQLNLQPSRILWDTLSRAPWTIHSCASVSPPCLKRSPCHIKPVHNSEAFSLVVPSADAIVACRVGALVGLFTLWEERRITTTAAITCGYLT